MEGQNTRRAGTNREPIGSFSCFSPVLTGGGPQRRMFLRISALQKKRLDGAHFPARKRRQRLALHLLCEDKGLRSAECGMRSGECGVRSAEGGVRKAEGRRRKAESSRRKAEGGRRKAEGGRRKAETGAQHPGLRGLAFGRRDDGRATTRSLLHLRRRGG